MTEGLQDDELLESRIKTQQKQTIYNSNSKVLEREIEVTNEAIQQVGKQIKLHINRKIIIPKEQQISLISGNNRSRSNNQTIKRNPSNHVRTDAVLNQYTRDDIRRKIILQNARLKTSLDALRQDSNIYKQNQMSILEVLKESKLKIVDYKSQIKSKSKKISQLLDTNMVLKGKIEQLQGKIGNITSYSQWQYNQIQQLKREVAQKFLQLQQTQVLKAKIDKLQQILKDYQQQFPQDSRSNITSSPHPLSTHSLSEPKIPTPYSIKEMGIQDLQMIRQYDGGDQEYNRLQEYNLQLKTKIEEMEGEIQRLKVDNTKKQRLLEGYRSEKEEKQEVYNIKINSILEKSQELTGKIEQKDISITNLQKQMHLQRQSNLKKQQQYINTINSLKIDIVNLQKIMDERAHQISTLHEQLNEKQQFFNREFEQISLQFNANEQKYTSELKQSQQKIKQLQQMINEDEIKMQQILAQNQQLNQFRNEVHEKYQYAQKIIKQRKDYEQFIQKLQSKIHYLQNLPNDNLEYYQSKLQQSQKYIRTLESQKHQHQTQFEQYALQIRLLKNQIKDLSRQRRDHIDHLDPSINVIQQQPQQSQGGLVSNTSLQQRQNVISGYHHHEQSQKKRQDFIPIFQSFPIEQEEELPPRKQSEDRSKNKSSEVYERLIRNLRDENQTLRVQKQEIMKKYTMDIVETNNEYFIERQKEAELNQKIKLLEEQLIQAGNNLIAKKFELQVKQTTLQDYQRRLKEYQQHIQDLQFQNNRRVQQVKQQSDLILKYQQIIEQNNSKFRDLTAKLSILSSQKQQLIQSKIKYQLSLQKMREQQEKLSSSKDMLTNSLRLQQNYKENIENQLLESRRLIKLVEEQKLSEKAVAEKMKRENQELYYRIREIEERMKILSSQKNTMQEQMIGYISDKEKLSGMQIRLQSENQELKIMKRQHQERIKIVENDILMKEHRIAELSKVLNDKNHLLQSSLSKKSQELQQALAKIEQMQQYQRQTMTQIQQKLSQLSIIINQQKAHILKLTTQKEQYINKKETLTRSVSELNQSQQSLKEVTDTMQRELQILSEENNHLRQTINKKNEENNQIKLENSQLKQDITIYERQKKLFLGQKQKLTIQYQLIKKQNEQTKTKLRTNEKMFKDISLNIANLKQSLDFSRSQLSQQSPTSIKQNQDSISLKLQQNEHSMVSIDNLKQEISQIQNKHKYVIQDYQKKLRSTSSHFQEASKQKQGKIQQLNSVIRILKQEKEELIHSKDSMQVIIKQLKQTMAEYINSIEQLEVSLSSEREIISSKDLIIQGLEKTINIKKSQIEQKEKIIHQMQEKHRLLKVQFQNKSSSQQQTDIKLRQMQKEWTLEKESQKKMVIAVQDQLEVNKKMMQEAQEEYQLKVNKLNKELSHCRFLLQQTQKQSSFRLQQSTKSITQVKNQLKIYNQTLRQKDQQIKQLKQSMNSLKQQSHQLRIKAQRHQQSANHYNSVKQQLQSYISTLDSQIQSQKQQLKRQRYMRQQYKDQQSALTNEINRLNLVVQQKTSQKDMVARQKQFLYSKYQRQVHDKVKMEEKMKDLNVKIKQCQERYEMLEKQFKKVQRKKQQQQSQLQVSTSNLIQQRKSIEEKYFNLIKQKDDQIESLKNGESKIHKQYQTRIENLCLQHKDLLLEVENQHSKQLQKKEEQIEKVIRESKTYIDHFKDKEKQAQDQLEKIKETLKKLQKQFENQRGELTDKVLQLTQQTNESNEVIENLRNGVVSKGNQIEQCKDIIQKLQQQLEQAKAQLSQFNSSKSIPVQGEDDYQLPQAKQKINKLETMLKQKQKVQKQLNEKIDKMKQRQNRQRNSSVESLASKSRVFDERNINLLQQLQDTKNKLESAEAYIQLLQDQQHKLKEEIGREGGNHQRNASAQDLQAQIQDLKMKVQFLQALNHQLQNGNDNQSVKSRRRNDSHIREPQRLKKSSISLNSDGNNFKIQGQSDMDLNKRIQLLIDFIDSYARDNSSGERQEALKSQLNHTGLQDLLSTIFYRLQKQTIIYKDKEHAITDLHDQIEALHEQIRVLRQNITFINRKCSLLEGYQKKYQQSQKSIEELINSKMKDEADVAECRSYIEELQNRLGKYESKREESKKEALQILEEQNQSSSDSMMSESADSEIPSSVSQSNNFKSSVAMSRRGIKGDHLSMSKSIVRTKSYNVNEQKIYDSQFLRKTVTAIKYLQAEVQSVEKQLQAKTKLLNIALNDSISKQQLINKISMIQSKMKMNDKQIKNHFETSQLQIVALIKDLLRYRQQQDQYGLQNENRRKIQDYLSLIEQQLVKSSKFYEEQSVKIQQNSRKSQMNRLAASLHQIKQDAVNEDKGSSIVYPRAQVLRSFSNSQGATQSLDINEIKVNYNQALKQLHQTHDELSTKQDQIRNIHSRYMGIQNDVCGILDEIRIYFQEDQYLFDQVEHIKRILSRFQQEEVSLDKVRNSMQKQQQDRMAMLVESNKKDLQIGSRKVENPFEKIIKFTEEQFKQSISIISNQHLKQIYTKISQILDSRYDQCLQFLNIQKSLIADILRIRNDEGFLEQTINKIASKLTQEEVADIITNSPNVQQANKILTSLLKEQDSKSMVSDEQDFSPDIDKIQQIRNKIYRQPTQLCLTMHNQLLQILGAPTRQHFYGLIEQFYHNLKDFQQKYRNELSQRDQYSETHSIKMNKVLQIPSNNLGDSMQKFDFMEVKHQKNRSSSCTVNAVDES